MRKFSHISYSFHRHPTISLNKKQLLKKRKLGENKKANALQYGLGNPLNSFYDPL